MTPLIMTKTNFGKITLQAEYLSNEEIEAKKTKFV